ncbi:MAG TPA: T9SS type A sorting domain-containing protein, partial [Chitinophagaceae bacterium]
KKSSVGSTEINEVNMLNVHALSNPSSNNFKLRITGSMQQKIILSVMDIYGRQVELRQVMQSNGTIQIGDSYRPGIYLISVTQGDQTKQLKLVKQ